MSKETEQIKAALTAKPAPYDPLNPANLLSTGCTPLNLACTGIAAGGFFKGGYFFFVGDSSSGKTFITLTCLAEAARNPNFANYDFVFYNRENGALMDFRRYFGPAVAERLKVVHAYEIPTLESYYYDLDDRLKGARPIIAITDSHDAFDTLPDEKKFEEQKTAHKKKKKPKEESEEGGDGKAPAGSYGMAKPKLHSQNLGSKIIGKLEQTGSILIGISQTRDNIKPGSFVPKTRAGGRALRFYAALEMWTSIAKQHKRTVLGNELQVGIDVAVQVKKNRAAGREWSVTIPIHFDTGIDDVGACVDFLTKWKHWKKEDSGTIVAGDFGFQGKREAIIQRIEREELEQDLRMAVSDVWEQIVEASRVERKPRYG